MNITRIICSECGTGSMHAEGAWMARCTDCGKTVDVDHDIKAYLDADERLTIDEAYMLVVVPA